MPDGILRGWPALLAVDLGKTGCRVALPADDDAPAAGRLQSPGAEGLATRAASPPRWRRSPRPPGSCSAGDARPGRRRRGRSRGRPLGGARGGRLRARPRLSAALMPTPGRRAPAEQLLGERGDRRQRGGNAARWPSPLCRGSAAGRPPARRRPPTARLAAGLPRSTADAGHLREYAVRYAHSVGGPERNRRTATTRAADAPGRAAAPGAAESSRCAARTAPSAPG